MQENRKKNKKFLALPMASRRQSWAVLSAKSSFADGLTRGRRQRPPLPTVGPAVGKALFLFFF
jgi:hypothetical protein